MTAKQHSTSVFLPSEVRRLVHYTPEPLAFEAGRQYENRSTFKPNGLWLSVEDGWGWADWCRSEEFGLDSLLHETEFRIEDWENILVLDSMEALQNFSDMFASSFNLVTLANYRAVLDWPAVTQRWQGIMIAPYQWGARWLDEHAWYYGWDCASACIWDLSVLHGPVR